MPADRCDGRRLAATVAGAVLAAAAVVVAAALLAGNTPYAEVGDADPGVLVAVGATVLRLLADLAATVCVGALVFVVSCTRPQATGVLTAPAYRELRIASAAGAVWSGCAFALVPFSAADGAGVPLPDAVVPAHLAGLLAALEAPRAWLITAALALLVATGCRAVLRWQPVVVLDGLALLAVLPVLVTGHGSSDIGHDLTIAALVVHVPVALVWVGALLAVLRQRAAPLPLLARYARLATWCWGLTAASGLALAVVLVPAAQVFTSGYGLLLAVKVVLVAALGATGWVLRGRVVRRAGGRPGRLRLCGVELVLLVLTVGVSAGLTHLALPGFLGRTLDTAQTLLGYSLAGPPPYIRLLTAWRPDLVFAPLALVLAAGYLAGVHRVRLGGRRWPTGRSAAWIAGCALLLLATSSGLGRYAAAMFSVHQAAHMLDSMLVPALLVLGGPLTLLAAAAPGRGELPGPHEVLTRLRDGRTGAALTHPLAVLVVFAGSPFALYFAGLFDLLVRFHWGHLLITTWFLGVGYLFFWLLIGVDDTPRALPNLARLGLLLAAMPADVLFGALLIGTHRVIGNGVASAQMYQALALPWVPDLLADQRLGGMIALGVGELTLFVVLGALLARWNTVDDGSGFGAYRVLARDAAHRHLAEAAQPQAVGHHEQR